MNCHNHSLQTMTVIFFSLVLVSVTELKTSGFVFVNADLSLSLSLWSAAMRTPSRITVNSDRSTFIFED